MKKGGNPESKKRILLLCKKIIFTILIFTIIQHFKLSFSDEFLFHEIFRSPPISCHQGYTTDGVYHYIIDTSVIFKRLNDENWTITNYNNMPFSGSNENYKHLGDGDYYNNKLYIPVEEEWQGCIQYHPAILIYDSNTLMHR